MLEMEVLLLLLLLLLLFVLLLLLLLVNEGARSRSCSVCSVALPAVVLTFAAFVALESRSAVFWLVISARPLT